MPRMSTLVLLLVLAVTSMWLIAKCSHRNDSPFGAGLPPKSGGDTLDVAIQFSPLAYRISGDSIEGMDFEMLEQLARMHGRAVKFHAFAPMQYALDGLHAGNFDIVVASLASTQKIKDGLALTRAVYLDREVLLQRADSATMVHRPEDLVRRHVWVPAGSAFAERLQNLAEELGDTIYVHRSPDRTAEHLAMLVAGGEIDYTVVSSALAGAMQSKFDNLDAGTPVSFTQFQVWAVAPDNTALRDTLNRWLGTYVKTGQYAALLEKYALRPAYDSHEP